MAAIQNDRDKLLQAAVDRLLPMPLPQELQDAIDATKGLSITSSADQIRLSGGAVNPTSIQFTARLRVITGTVAWSVSSGTATLTADGNTATMTAASMTTERVRVEATITVHGVTYVAEHDVSKIQDGSNGDAVDIVFRRSPARPDTPAPSASTPSEWFSDVASVPPNSAPLWSCVGKKTGSSTNFVWSMPAQLEGTGGADGADGTDGKSVAELTIYQRAAGTPATPTGGSYNFGTATLNPPSGWSWAVPSGAIPVYISKTVVVVAGATGTIVVTGWSTPILGFQDGAPGAPGAPGANGAQGANGVRGTVRLSVSVASAAWDSTVAGNLIMSETGSSLRVVGDEVTEYSAANGWAQTRKWNGSSWALLTQLIDGNLIVNGTVTSDAIKGKRLEGVDIIASSVLTVGGIDLASSEVFLGEEYGRVLPRISLIVGVEGSSGSSRMTFSGSVARVLAPRTELGLTEAGGLFYEYARFDANGCFINTRSGNPALTITNDHGPALKLPAFSSLASSHGNGCIAYHPSKGLVFTHAGVVHTVAVTGT